MIIKTRISMISSDSRKIKSGGAFLAVRGVIDDGTKYIQSAVENGAKVVITHNDVNTSELADNIEVIKCDNPRKNFAQLCSHFYKPAPTHYSAITGTNGKTSIANFTQSLWEQSGHKAIATGTLGFIGSGYKPTSSLTTPDPAILHEQLHRAKIDKNVDYVCMEASSHGLDMCRLDGVKFMSAGFSNLSRDHLDYHTTMQNYFDAKSRLFTDLLSSDGTAILNATIPEFDALNEICKSRKIKVMSYGILEICNSNIIPDIQLVGYKTTANGFNVDMSILGMDISSHIPLPGLFQLENVLCALGLTSADGSDIRQTSQYLDQLKGVRGRLEYVAITPSGGMVYVDYAHTPNALETILKTMKPHTTGALKVIVGCGGDRDTGKRPIMGKIAVNFSDNAFITDDNPRTENPDNIRCDVMVGAVGATEIKGRGEAIFEAVNSLQSGDVLIVAGKGHEQGQIIGDKVLPFDDANVVRSAIESLV